MMNYSKEPKQEGENNISRVSSSAAGAWFRSKDPRIVRVSRAFGGKDRHSKVCTVRGLRDRRVRLSVPTAIQLYDLQDRLGLNQPSKVVDWLLDAAKDEINELPPLPNIIHPALNFGQSLQLIDQNRLLSENWGRNNDIEEQDQDEAGSGEEIPTTNFGHNNNNNAMLFPYGYSEETSSVSSNLHHQHLQLANESHGFVSIAHHHHHLVPNSTAPYIPMMPYLRTSLVEMDHQVHMEAPPQQLQMGSASSFFTGRLPFDFDVNARVGPSSNGGSNDQ